MKFHCDAVKHSVVQANTEGTAVDLRRGLSANEKSSSVKC